MSADAKAEGEEAEVPHQPTSGPQGGSRKRDYLLHTKIRTMLGNPSATYRSKTVVTGIDEHATLKEQWQKRKEEKKRKKEEKKRQEEEFQRKWEETQRELEEEAARRQEVTTRSSSEIHTGGNVANGNVADKDALPEAFYCNKCGFLSNASGTEYEYSVNTHLTALFLTLCLCCCLPYVLRCCMDEVFYCSVCGAYLGNHSTFSRRSIF